MTSIGSQKYITKGRRRLRGKTRGTGVLCVPSEGKRMEEPSEGVGTEKRF